MAEKKKNRYGPLVIVGVVLVGMAGFGSSGFTSSMRSLGTVGDKDVPITDYQRQLNAQIQNMSRQFNTQITFQQAISLGLDRQALQAVVQNRTLDNEAANLGLSVGDQRVFDQLKSIPEFQGRNGFNADSYRLALQQSGQNEGAFETSLREEMARTLLQGAVVGGVPQQDVFGDTMIAYIAERRSATWAAIDAEALDAPTPGATDADIQSYYDEHPEDFTLPETRDITYVWLAPDMIQDEMDVPETAIEQLYQDRIADFVQPERRLVERLVYLDAQKAEDARARVDAGEATFEDLVTERGLSLNDVDMGDVDQEELRAAGTAVFEAAPGDVVGPFNSPLGPALFRMNAVLAAQETPLEEASAELRDELAADAAREVISDSTDGILDLIAGGATLEDLADRTNLELGTINWTDQIAEGIAAYDDFRDAAARVEEGAFAEVIDLADGGIFALRLDGITPPAVRPLDEVRDAAAEAWQVQARQDAVMARATELSADIQSAEDFETLGLIANTEENMTRTDFIEGTPPVFNEELFKMAVGDVAVLDAGDRAVIVRLDAIAGPDESDELTASRIEALAGNATTAIAQDIYQAYSAALQQETDVNINQATVNAVNAQFQ
ncbi:peptidyl-prolyl cis-trans isomerase [Loktanella sp. S4079]|uniref:peptidyl-prolyl cis-trans isomerase n=1 Tax=Loktanella sp. S4079 TaxID=579483 RepID=UPI0005FA78EF|nr:peptidyl-prolyl cis-trans isomerase [Loktanella sp. S4079]KJZ19977.1 peptidylprolyl isomerase [Loktanella sp. S4079]